jgi:hypothetical protein
LTLFTKFVKECTNEWYFLDQAKNYTYPSFTRYVAMQLTIGNYQLHGNQQFFYNNPVAQTDPPEVERAKWQAMNLWNFIVNGCRYTGFLLQKEPLQIPSQRYKDVELTRRTYADLRHELEVKLVSLPRYQAICTLVGGEQAVQVKTPAPYVVTAETKQKAEEIRHHCRQQIGKPWTDVLAAGKKQHRTIPKVRLPPAKDRI